MRAASTATSPAGAAHPPSSLGAIAAPGGWMGAVAIALLWLGAAAVLRAVVHDVRLLVWFALFGLTLTAHSLWRARLDSIALQAQVAALSQQLAESRSRAADAVQAEHQRLLRELHDGLGSSLIAAANLLEQRRLDAQDAACVLRDCIDDLRLLMDSAEPVEHDLTSLLATLRYRLGRRLQRAGLQIDWQVAELPPQPWLGPAEAHEILRILQEAFANVVKHAGAHRLAVATEHLSGHAAAEDAVRISLQDDGCGFDADRLHGGRGLRHMRQRAERLGASLAVVSSPRGTCVSLQLSRAGFQSRNSPPSRAS